MNKGESGQFKHCIQSENHPSQTTLGFCSFLENLILVDVVICCGNNILHAHKLVLAVNSAFFREELEKDPSIEQVVITGCDFPVVRCLVEFMYCGKTILSEEDLKYFVAAAKTLRMVTLENLTFDFPFSDDVKGIPKPTFLSKKPKYAPYPSNAAPASSSTTTPISCSLRDLLYKPHAVKRKPRIRAEHQAFINEARASQLTIANLAMEIASAPQAITFVIEEASSGTTVKNFIPHTSVGSGNVQASLPTDPKVSNNVIQLSIPDNTEELTANKVGEILGNEANSNVRTMFKASACVYDATVTDEVIQNLQEDGLQYQMIDEDLRLGEFQGLQLFDMFDSAETKSQDPMEPCKAVDQASALIDQNNVEILSYDPEELKSLFEITPIGSDNYSTENDLSTAYTEKEADDLNYEIKIKDEKGNQASAIDPSPEAGNTLPFSPDMFFAD